MAGTTLPSSMKAWPPGGVICTKKQKTKKWNGSEDDYGKGSRARHC